MAITKVREVERIEVYPAVGADSHPTVMVVYQHVFDDDQDDQLPVKSPQVIHLKKSRTEIDEETNEVITVLTEITGEDQLVQDVCNAIWPE